MTKDELTERMKYVRISERRGTLFLIGIILFIIGAIALATIGWIVLIRIYGVIKMIG